MGYSDNCHFRNKEIKINEKSSNVYTNFIGLGISIWQSGLGKTKDNTKKQNDVKRKESK